MDTNTDETEGGGDRQPLNAIPNTFTVNILYSI
jgi:hypothetical protein